MSFGGMKGAGPGCCCCQDVYGRTGQIERVNGRSGDLLGTTGQDLCDFPYFDYVNKKLYYCRTDATTIRVADHDDLANKSTFMTAASSERYMRGISVHPQSETFYFSRRDHPATTIRYITRIDLDGATGQADIISFDCGTTSELAGGMYPIAVSRDDGFLFYFDRDAAGQQYLKRANADGSGVTTIFTPGPTDSTAGGINVDNGRQKVQFDIAAVSGTGIRRCDWDGGNLETLFTVTGGDIARLAGYSHNQDRIYFWNESSSIGPNGRDAFCSMAPDGSDFHVELRQGNSGPPLFVTTGWEGNANPSLLKLGCGYETLGAGTRGS